MTQERKDGKPAEATEDRTAPQEEGTQKHYALPKIDFSTFILSINSSALVQLGLIEDPASGRKTRNLALAKQTIDLIAMLEEKTRGNLTSDEENILKNILYELRMLYVKEKG
ncbi:DUF1844 domain-containing protein [Desulfatitalea alkaliphila]|uniref:DUF1844 domain-containing protein n=1 Tax=Desulfatitalea alkaliphila TaxID=2929485 RepID=A0AA41UJE7_9BACT|nr:DUF1844 domain-containing protein [Desulfatitalea alkaliphila]MCJ8500457.1 DUF1844 domain-containing protein [Desulfatitalea alkaliphila]